MPFLVKNKKYNYEHGAKMLEELISDLEEDEILCSVVNLLTGIKMRVFRKMLFTFCERNEVRDKRGKVVVKKIKDSIDIYMDY